MSTYTIELAEDGTIFGEGETLEAAVMDALENAYWGEDGNTLLTRDKLNELYAEYRETGGASGLYVVEGK